MHVVLPVRAGRGPICADSARDAGPRRLDRAGAAGRTVPRQAAAFLLAGDAELLDLWRARLGGTVGAGARGAWHDSADLPAWPKEFGNEAGVLGRARLDARAR